MLTKAKRNRKQKIPQFQREELVPQQIEESQIKNKTVMSWSLGKKKKEVFFILFILSEGNFLRFVFYLNVQCIEYTFRIYILLHIKKYYFIHFCCLFLKLTKAFSVSLSHFNFTRFFSVNPWDSTTFFSDLKCFYRFLFYHA